LRDERLSFQNAGVESPDLSAELLLASSLGLDRPGLLRLALLEPDHPLEEAAMKRYAALRERRLAGEPMAYILGGKEFYGRLFRVTPDALIPRPETELLVDAALEHLAGRPPGRFADLGTGSGCIAITLALELGPEWRGLALDFSAPALRLALENARALGAANLAFILGDYTCPPLRPASLDLLVANPPYISEGEYAALDHGVRAFEPVTALVAGPEGTEQLLGLLALGAEALRPAGLLLLELGQSQGQSLLEAASAQPAWSESRILRDLTGRDRLLLARRGQSESLLFSRSKGRMTDLEVLPVLDEEAKESAPDVSGPTAEPDPVAVADLEASPALPDVEDAPPEQDEGHARLLEVRFRRNGGVYLFRADREKVAVGDKVMVETEQGASLAEVVSVRADNGKDLEIRPIKGLAGDEDLSLAEENRNLASESRLFCRQRIRERNLDMKLVDVEVFHDRSKMIFYFTAPGRVDFRDLVKDLVQEYHIRIELRQIGVRHEVQMIGALGNCGMACCCRRYLRRFAPVTIKMAKEQNLFLNPAKLSGICGRLLCCLANEQENYEDFHRNSPKLGKKYQTGQGVMKVIRANLFRQSIVVLTEVGEEREFMLEAWSLLNPVRLESKSEQQQPRPHARKGGGGAGRTNSRSAPEKLTGGRPEAVETLADLQEQENDPDLFPDAPPEEKPDGSIFGLPGRYAKK